MRWEPLDKAIWKLLALTNVALMSWWDGRWESGGIQNYNVFEKSLSEEEQSKWVLVGGGYKIENSSIL